MPESSTINLVTQIGKEGTPGTGVPANKKLLGFSIGQFVPTIETEAFTPMGYKYPTLVDPNAEWSTAPVTGKPDYNSMLYALAGILGNPTTTQYMDTATPTGAYRHVFTPSSIAADTIPTFTVEQGNSSFTQKVLYALLNALNFSFPRRGAPTLGGSMMARNVEDGITLTASPTEVEAVPILSNTVDVFMDDTSGALGTTKLLRAFRYDWSLGDRQGVVWPLNSALPSFAAHYETMPAGTLAINFANDAAARALLPTLRAGQSKFIRMVATGPRIYDGTVDYFYKLQVDVAAKINAAYSAGDEANLSTIQWPFTIVHNATFGAAIKAELVNTVAAL